MDAYWPKDCPVTRRRIGELTTSELRRCLLHAEDRIAAEPGDSPERGLLQEWLRALLAQKDARAMAHAAMAEDYRYLAQATPGARRGGRPRARQGSQASLSWWTR